MELRDLWAKKDPFQSVITHGLVVGTIAQIIYRIVLAPGNRNLLEKTLRMDAASIEHFLGYWSSLHDIGKIEYTFQSKDPNTTRFLQESGLEDYVCAEIRHEKTSETIINRIWAEAGIKRRCRKFYAGLLKAHHQGKKGVAHQSSNDQWQALQNQYEVLMRNQFIEEFCIPEFPEEKQGPVAAIFLGILVLADWIASGEVFMDAETVLAEENGLITIRKRAEAFFDNNDFLPSNVSWEESFCGVWPNISEAGRRPLQVEMQRLFETTQQRIRLVLVEAPMGEGKTEAGLYAALQMQKQWEKNGFYVALPTAATSNQMVGRIRKLMKMHNVEDTVRLLHAMAWLVDDHVSDDAYQQEDADIIRSWLAPVRRGLLSPYAVGTVDQVMLAATQIKYGVLRLLGLANKVLVIDEIHSYDVYMNEIIKQLLKWCRALEIPVVMLSATLPKDKKADLLEAYGCCLPEGSYPAITAVLEDQSAAIIPAASANRSMTIKTELVPILEKPDSIAELAVSAVEHGGCLCVLMNTVAQAQQVYNEIQKRYSGELYLFHARFPAARRNEIEKTCIKLFGKDKAHRPKQAILVATQVVEQSLDVDFDAMILAAAPIDLIMQRLGRVHRHMETERPLSFLQPCAWILITANGQKWGANSAVYPECLLDRSVTLLKGKDTIRLPEELAPLVQEGYNSSKISQEELSKWIDMQIQDSMKAASSRLVLLSNPENEFSPVEGDQVFDEMEESGELSVKTRLGEPTIRVALLEDALYQKVFALSECQTAAVKDRQLAQEILSQSVSLRQKQVSGILSGPLPLKGARLIAGVEILPMDNGCFRDGNGTVIYNDYLQGVYIRQES